MSKIDFTTRTVTPIYTGGSRGDFATVGPDGCFYATQTDSVVKITSSDGTCSLAPIPPGGGPNATPELGSGELIATGLLPLGLALVIRRRRAWTRARRAPRQ